MAYEAATSIPAGTVRVVFTDRTDGDFAVAGDPDLLAVNRRSVVGHPWTWLRQVHGGRVVAVSHAGQWSGTEADGAATVIPEAPLAIMTADCAPVVLIAERGFAVVHAGWRGLVAGIVENAAEELAKLGAAAPVTVMVGPCINPAAYEFSAHDLTLAVDRFGAAVRGQTSWGTAALDVPAAVVAACEQAGWPPPEEHPACTSNDRWFSHRTRADAGRQAAVAWLESTGGSSAPEVGS